VARAELQNGPKRPRSTPKNVIDTIERIIAELPMVGLPLCPRNWARRGANRLHPSPFFP